MHQPNIKWIQMKFGHGTCEYWPNCPQWPLHIQIYCLCFTFHLLTFIGYFWHPNYTARFPFNYRFQTNFRENNRQRAEVTTFSFARAWSEKCIAKFLGNECKGHYNNLLQWKNDGNNWNMNCHLLTASGQVSFGCVTGVSITVFWA